MFWIAKKSDGTIVSLTEKEALTHFKSNNVASRMRLEFVGTSDGTAYAKKRRELMEKHKEELQRLKGDNINVPVSIPFVKKLNDIEQEALQAEAEVAKENGITQPDKGLDVLIQGEGVDNAKMQQARQRLRSLAG